VSEKSPRNKNDALRRENIQSNTGLSNLVTEKVLHCSYLVSDISYETAHDAVNQYPGIHVGRQTEH
jgi:hypothetical protein